MSRNGARRARLLPAGESLSDGETPLDHMLSVMNDETAEISRRDRMAKAAARYVHARLSPMKPSTALSPKIALALLTDEALCQPRRMAARLKECAEDDT